MTWCKHFQAQNQAHHCEECRRLRSEYRRTEGYRKGRRKRQRTRSYRAWQRAYKHERRYGPRPPTRREKALAWLRSAPRTSRQIADLLGITPVNAATMLYQLRRAGRVVAEGSPLRYRVCQVH